MGHGEPRPANRARFTCEPYGPADRDRLLNGLLRIVPQPDNGLSDEKKLDLLQKTMGLCQADRDRSRALERAEASKEGRTWKRK